jgi:transcriptional regulator with XRE-family HTH domain
MQKESGRKFRQLRRHLDITQKEFASFLGVTLPTICKWEKKGLNYQIPDFKRMMDVGINPLYCFGQPDILLPEQKINEVVDRIYKAIGKRK